MPAINRWFKATINPGTPPSDLLSGFDIVCAAARRELRSNLRDAYVIDVEYLAPGEYVELDQALSIAETFGRRRLLTPHELMAVNKQDRSIRWPYPVFIRDFVLEFELEDAVGVEGDDCRRDWAILPASLHRGRVLDKDAVIATTRLTSVERGFLSEWSLRDVVAGRKEMEVLAAAPHNTKLQRG